VLVKVTYLSSGGEMYRALLLCILVISQALATGPDEVGVLKVTIDEAETFLGKIPDGYETQYGFKDRSEFSKIEIGVPLKVFTMNPDSIDEKGGASRMYLKDVNEWRVPVTINNEYRALITVVKSGGKFQAVDFGGVVLAKRIGTITGSYSGYVNNIVRIYSIQSDYILADSAGVKGEEGIYIPVNQAQYGAGGLKKTADVCLSKDAFLSTVFKRHQQTKNNSPVHQ
jgi:hypothetical protein